MQCGWAVDETEVQHLWDKIVNWHIHIYLHAPLVILCRSHCTYHVFQIIKWLGKIKQLVVMHIQSECILMGR